MSLIDGPDLVLVYPEVAGDDGYGTPTRVPSTTAVRVRGRMQPVSAEEAVAFGQGVTTMYRLIARSVPGGAWAKVAWDGREWDVVGEPTVRPYSLATSHTTVFLRARTPKAVT